MGSDNAMAVKHGGEEAQHKESSADGAVSSPEKEQFRGGDKLKGG